ncbi:outer membrane lipoprotein-sorting protein (plasmid) [Entomospira entomophila]|uniref:Outer membrane lipoprotein-sorting protein n=1 Tax=Entomospira entomophila TaxID=2719988 RepID=A0A968KUF9_9SPIO|nr:outer membrane lipoprotein-sorting protein [Entomospira entomophilus]NIZ41431.1 outer membrane lipoprotein-sorting protein [Entomospira entomophilus]WDI36381.1 outer membrane lipoprotein-sorting protein [Entomospira entomophilus]
MKYLYYLLLLIISTPAIMAQTAREIVDRADANASFAHATMQATITSTDTFGTKVYQTQIQQSGRDDSLIVFLAGENKGQKILRTPNELFVYYPDADNVVRLKGAALRQSAFGDVSYEDLANSKTRSDRFDLTLVSSESINGFTTWVIDLVAKNKGESYPKQRLWIDQATYTIVRAEYRSDSGKLLRELNASDIVKRGNQFIATQLIFKDATKKNSSSTLSITKIDLDTPLPTNTFTVANLSF